MALLDRAVQQGYLGRHLLQLLQQHASKNPVSATLKGLVHHGRHVGSGFVARSLRDQVRLFGHNMVQESEALTLLLSGHLEGCKYVTV